MRSHAFAVASTRRHRRGRPAGSSGGPGGGVGDSLPALLFWRSPQWVYHETSTLQGWLRPSKGLPTAIFESIVPSRFTFCLRWARIEEFDVRQQCLICIRPHQRSPSVNFFLTVVAVRRNETLNPIFQLPKQRQAAAGEIVTREKL